MKIQSEIQTTLHSVVTGCKMSKSPDTWRRPTFKFRSKYAHTPVCVIMSVSLLWRWTVGEYCAGVIFFVNVCFAVDYIATSGKASGFRVWLEGRDGTCALSIPKIGFDGGSREHYLNFTLKSVNISAFCISKRQHFQSLWYTGWPKKWHSFCKP